MGLSGRKPILPAPTESLVDSGLEDTGLSTELATNLSRRTDRTSATIPDDGREITISTGHKGKVRGKHTTSADQSQTSLLIEYYEGQKEPGSNRQPSFRVRVRPSAGKNKDKSESYVAVTREQGSRKHSETQRIPLGSRPLVSGAESVSSIGSPFGGYRTRSAPIDIEIEGKESEVSDMSASPEARYIAATSDISSMPPDSILGTASGVARAPRPSAAVSSLLTNSEMGDISELRSPSLQQEHTQSHERISQKAVDKLSNKERDSSRSVNSSRKSRSRSGSATYEIRNPPVQERQRKSGKTYPEESSISGGAESMISNSVLSAGAKSFDDKSVRSGTSNITNPKLLQTVEDAIRRLILPELKEIKRNGSQRTRHREELASDLSDNSIAQEKSATRRVSSSSRSRKKISRDHGSASGSRRRHRRDRDVEYDSQSEASSHRAESISSAGHDVEHRSKSREKSTSGRDLTAGALVGGALTAAALQHQDSSSTLERRRRRKRSKSRSSRSASVADSEDTFEKHAVPPMPFRSEIGSEVTRSSLLSSNTNTTDTATPTQRDVRQVVRGSPFGGDSPALSPPTQAASDLRQTLGTHHRNFSGHDLGVQRNSFDTDHTDVRSVGEYSPEIYHDNSFATAGLLADPERIKAYERNLHQQHPIRRGLSPIQSVASYATTDQNRHSTMQTRSIDSISSFKRQQQQLKEEVSMDSFMSASPSMQKSGRPHGTSLDDRGLVLPIQGNQMEHNADKFYEEQHDENNRYRNSYASYDPNNHTGLRSIDRQAHFADDKAYAAHPDKVASGQQVAQGLGANPEYIHTPPGVESAVASLIDPSVLDVQTSQSPRRSATELVHEEHDNGHLMARDVGTMKSHSPLREHGPVHSTSSLTKARVFEASPPQSPASFEEDRADVINVPQGENKSATSPESEITTNPSVIQGPIGGLSAGNRDHWPYGPTPDRPMQNVSGQQALGRDLGLHAPDLIPDALNLSQRQNFDNKSDVYSDSEVTQPGVKDEGYATGDNPRSPGLYAKQKDQADVFSPDDLDLQDDPFVTKQTQNRNKYMSGLSQGMSPLYDSATGRGIDRIQSKDVVALMDHLTVRDAQRNARDTEILVTLVRSAAEMRNSFEDMKKFIAEQDGLIMSSAETQHEKTQRIIGGPRPPPPSARATQRSLTSPDESLPAKRRNIFKRALQGLGSKNATELQNIEQMLMQLLDDVEDLRTLQVSNQANVIHTPVPEQPPSIGSAENARAPTDTGYEPSGQAGTSSTIDRAVGVSSQPSRHEYRIVGGQRESVNRVSTVIEGDEDDDGEESDEYEAPRHGGINRNTALSSHLVEDQYRHTRALSVPAETPQKMHDPSSTPWSHDNNPHSADATSARKNKSLTSSFLPKLMSRWSKTTASTEPRFSTQAQARPYSQVSRSGSDLAEYVYDPQVDDRLRSATSLQGEHYQDQENRPPSPLVPSQVSENPKYQGYRNSKNFEHPQPRQGPTGRYQTQLENEAHHYHDQFSPSSQTSSQWDNQAALRDVHRTGQDHYQHQPRLSPISDGGYSEDSDRRSSTSSRRHTRIMDDEPLVPQRPPKIPMSPSTYVDQVAAARAGSPAYDNSPISALRSPQGSGRKPSGPRPYNGGSQNGSIVRGDLNTVKKTRFRGSPYHTSSTEDMAHGTGV